MGVRIMHNDEEAIMYCSSTDWAFGPLFSDDGNHSAVERAESFLRWLGKGRDPRQYTDAELESKYTDWRGQEEAQWKAEDDAEKARWADDE